MPLAVALLIRTLIQAISTTALFVLADKLLAPLIDLAKKVVAQAFGMTEAEAEDTIANEVIDALSMIGILGVAIRTKIPTIAAEKLGFTSKGFTKRKVSAKLPAGIAGTAAQNAVAATSAKVLTEAEAGALVAQARGSLRGAKGAFDYLTGKLAVTFLGFLTLAQFIDFGNWETGAYAKFFQNLYEKITFGLLKPDEDYAKSKVTSPEVFSKVFNTYTLSGATGIKDPDTGIVTPFSREAFIALADKMSAKLLMTQKQASAKNVLLATQLFIQFDPAKVAGGVGVLSTAAPSSAVLNVFRGLVTQSALGAAVPFTPRQDDLIENMNELREAAKNNEAPFMASLPGRVIREIKIVPTITTKNDFTLRVKSQRFISNYLKDGTTKYKTIVNKFAVADVYILTEKGVRTKISRIVYGPVDSATFHPEQNEISAMEKELKAALETKTPSVAPSVLPPPVTKVEIIKRDYFTAFEPPFERVYYASDETLVVSPDVTSILTRDERAAAGNFGAQVNEARRRLSALGYPLDSFPPKKFHNMINGKVAAQTFTDTFEQFFGTSIKIEARSADAPLPAAALEASTLFDFYAAQSLPLPSVSVRGQLYQTLDLGQADLYAGTAEQNLKLLTKLQGKI